jgi:Cof subfamily protein (haloacid dehalogenase superfamily)
MNSNFLEVRPIIVFDLDGTLINQQGGINPMDVALLVLPEPPAVFVPATGRSMYGLRKLFQLSGIFNGSPIPYPLILQNGSLVYNRGEQKLLFSPFDPVIQTDLINLCNANPSATYLLFGENSIRTLHPNQFGTAETEKYLLFPEEYNAGGPFIPLSKIMCLSEDPDYLKGFMNKAKRLGIEVSMSNPTLLEMNPLGITKGTGLELLVEHNQWKRDEVYCAGDAGNDLDMFKKFPNSFAPETSPESIRACAAHVIDTEECGLFTPILEFIKAGK